MHKKIACVFIAVLMAAMAFAGCGSDKETAESTTSDKSTATSAKTTQEPYPGELTNILLMGSLHGDFSDKNNQNYALTHILITLDPQNLSMRFTTFPYNLRIKPVLPSDFEENYEQLQSLYANYGGDVVADTISRRFDIDIDGWVVMNAEGVKSIVDELGGLNISIKSLDINENAKNFETIFNAVWNDDLMITDTGRQKLTGMQVLGYFIDTQNGLDPENALEQEELIFREKHPAIIDALISAVKIAKVDEKRVVEIAKLAEDNFDTNIKEREWEKIAAMALACMESRHEYLHIPQTINVAQKNATRYITYDEVKDVNAVIEFAGKK
jgi:hypothetical protein